MEKCFRCYKPGHKSNECPLRKLINLIGELGDYGLLEEEEIEEGSVIVERAEQVFGDEGEQVSCVVQRLLLSRKHDGNNQQHSIFRTRCTINNKVCDLIINSGSSDNFVFKAIVKALGLITEKHPWPYKIRWIKKGVKETVDSICRVRLSISTQYQDTVLCDVIKMDASHILFGRPWEYDVDTRHNGRSNNYEFSWFGKRIALMPLSNPTKTMGNNSSTSGKILFTSHGRHLEFDYRAAKILWLYKKRLPTFSRSSEAPSRVH